ncbi:MAG: PhnD/SsuA/transferrin family substrate-binding protein [Pseudomonadota bacterium]
MFCSWGMYAVSPALREAWQRLHEEFLTHLRISDRADSSLRFETGADALLDPALLLGHTCGYPLVTAFSDTHTPICVPLFDVDGTDGNCYSSAIVVRVSSSIKTLADAAGTTVAVNNEDSNSGMNVLRDRIAEDSEQQPFFGETRFSGGHRDSVVMVSRGEADIAAIDCVTFALLRDIEPELTDSVRVLGYTRHTTGLPFVIPKHNPLNLSPPDIIEALRTALDALDEDQRSTLRITDFAPVEMQDYQSIRDMEEAAQRRNHLPTAL